MSNFFVRKWVEPEDIERPISTMSINNNFIITRYKETGKVPSDGAFVMYLTLLSLPGGMDFTTKWYAKEMSITVRTANKRFKELEKADLVFVVKNKYYEQLYISSNNIPASEIKRIFDNEEEVA